MELICLFCSVPVAHPVAISSSNPDLDHPNNRHLFDLISASLSVDDEVSKMWDFGSEGLPFCPECRDRVTSYFKYQSQLDSIQLEMSILLEQVKCTVRSSAKASRSISRSRGAEAGATPSSSRFDVFRQQVISGGETRRICSTRVATITGLPPRERGDSSSIKSWDELSQDAASELSSEDEGVNIKSEEGLIDMDIDFESDNQDSPMMMDGDNMGLMPWLASQRVGDNLLNEILQDAEDPNRVGDKPRWVELDDKITFGYVEVIVPKDDKDIQALWKCGAEDCTFQFEAGSRKYQAKAMARHIIKTHYPSKECPGCGITFETFADMREHACTVSKPKEKSSTKRCRKCSTVFANPSLLKLHDCPAKERKEQENNVPVSETDNDPNSPPCPSEPFPRKKAKVFECNLCSKILSSKATLHRHVETHTKSTDERKTMICEHCGLSFSPWQLTRHKRDVHGVGTPKAKFPCNFLNCGKSFPNQTKLKRHMKTHEKAADEGPRRGKRRIVTLGLNEESLIFQKNNQ